MLSSINNIVLLSHQRQGFVKSVLDELTKFKESYKESISLLALFIV